MAKSAGTHLIIDGFVRDAAVYTEGKLTELFHKLVEALNMTIIFGPVFKEVELDPSKFETETFQDEGGITGMCVISTSHLSIHTWPLDRRFSMDVFSCKGFDTEKAIDLIKAELDVAELSMLRVERHFPPGIQQPSSTLIEVEPESRRQVA